MKNIIAELDKICNYIESFEEDWVYPVIWRIEKVATQLDELHKNKDKAKKVLDKFVEKPKKIDVKELIRKQGNKNALVIYKNIKKHFGKLNRNEAIEFIKNILND